MVILLMRKQLFTSFFSLHCCIFATIHLTGGGFRSGGEWLRKRGKRDSPLQSSFLGSFSLFSTFFPHLFFSPTIFSFTDLSFILVVFYGEYHIFFAGHRHYGNYYCHIVMFEYIMEISSIIF